MRAILFKLFIFSIALQGCTYNKYAKKPKNKKHHEVIRIQPVGGGGLCSAFVISDTIALTAAHCVTRVVGFGLEVVRSGFKITNSAGEDTGVIAKVSMKNIDMRMDSAALVGDFSKFNKMPVLIKDPFLKEGSLLIHCGYAKGHYPPVCTKGELVGRRLFQIKSTAFLVPGMSGGPVINRHGVAVGINSAVTGDLSLYCPTFGMLQLTEKKGVK